MSEPLSSDDKLLTCQCAVSYHQVVMPDGNVVQVLDAGAELPDIMMMCFGRCERCGLPFHNEFIAEEV
jgi:hypothetical protein